MENLFKSWISQHLGVEEEQDGIIINQSHMMNNSLDEEQEFLMEIFNNGQPDFSPETSHEHYYYSSPNNDNNNNNVPNNCDTIPNNNNNGVSFEDTTLKKSNSYNYMMSLEKNCSSSTSSSYVLSFEPNSSSKERRTSEDGDGFEDATTKKLKAKTPDHIMAERKRRQDLTTSVIQLAATIPGLKKMDKAYVIREALNYIKALQDRIEELENQNKHRKVDSAILIGRSQDSSTDKSSIISCETTSDNNGGAFNESSLEIEAKVLEKEVLIRIQYEKPKNNIMLKIHALLDKLHLSIACNSVLPFGTSAIVIITIVAQDLFRYHIMSFLSIHNFQILKVH
ncbi:hypothetical protein PIB30_057925 [Stylosanthes scabra]|uniref:BHLH domain-containing protein n=1 Tax=Stylosanthes scabra TaxID=79078 RepID=A0ABU6SJS7_9FABA|nr:hypothetical protein [Stylosanthes scabra]